MLFRGASSDLLSTIQTDPFVASSSWSSDEGDSAGTRDESRGNSLSSGTLLLPVGITLDISANIPISKRFCN